MLRSITAAIVIFITGLFGGHQLQPPSAQSQPAAAATALSGTLFGSPTSTPSQSSGAADTQATTTIVNNYITNPIERVVDSDPLAPANFVTQDELNAQLLHLSNALTQKFTAPATSSIPQYVAADGNPAIPYAAENSINNLSNVTITDANITTSEIPDLSASYLSLSGGAVSGATSFANDVGIGTTSILATFTGDIKNALDGELLYEDGSSIPSSGLTGGSPSLLTLEIKDDNTYYSFSQINDLTGSVGSYVSNGNGLGFDSFDLSSSETGSNYLLGNGGFAFNDWVLGSNTLGIYSPSLGVIGIGALNAWNDLTPSGPPVAVFDTVSNNVGIGTTTPDYFANSRLVINGGGISDGGAFDGNSSLVIETSDSVGAGISLDQTGAGGNEWSITSGGPDAFVGTGNLEFYDETSDSNPVAITSSGQVGIGTTTPWASLSVTGPDTSSAIPAFVVADSNNNPLFSVFDDGGVLIGTTTSDQAGLTIDGTYPHDGLEITSSANTGQAGALVMEDSPNDFINGDDVGDFDILATQQLNFSADFGATDQMSITGAGNVGIGTTTPYSRLEVWGPDSAASTTAFAVVNAASTTEFTVRDNGNATLAGSLIQSSDQRLKTNVQTLNSSSSLAAINSLNPVTFNWIDPNKGTAPQLGFIAQQVLPIFPNLVSTTSPTALTPNGTLSVNYIGFIAPIISAIQALDQQLTDLANTVAGFAQSFTTNQLTFNRASGSEITSNDVNTQELCVGSTCVTPAQFQAMVAAAGQSNGPASSPNGSTSTADATDTPPVIQVKGDNPATVQVGDTYNDLGATITGPQDDLNLGITTYVNGVEMNPVQIDTTEAATDTIDYVATDQSGLSATSTRTVIIESAAPPSIVPTDAASTTDATSTAQ